ncbi:MAG: tRNA pseudouridine(38-40) synthase TruA [Candidatus Caldatribacteriota bacterium]
MYHYRLVVSYVGTQYLGWQIQPESYGRTIQGEINIALEKIAKSSDVRSLGSGRTDTGVHALGQVVKVSIPLEINPYNLLKAMNSHLPEDIRVLEASVSTHEFIPTVHAKSKEYHYRFSTQEIHSPFAEHLISHYPYEIDLKLMKEACQIFIGKHDFTNFYVEGTPVSSFVREIYECEILQVPESDLFPSYYVFRVVGNGFLKQMVRLMVGTIWRVGRGKVTLEELKESLSPVKKEKLAPVAPGHGLYLVRVNY